MQNINPDFRGADEVIKPENAEFGWAVNVSEAEAILLERRGEERLQAEMPAQMTFQEEEEPLPGIVEAWNTFQQSKGRFPGSYDWSILDEFVSQGPILYPAQIIGSCVISNTLPGWVAKLMYQIVFLGLPMEYIGRDQRGSNNYAPYGPYSYGAARKRVNLRGGDGLFCEGMVESLLKDGVLPCSNPDLIALNKKLGVDRPQDYFEPQNPAVYRAWGDWKYVDEFSKYADYRAGACPYVKSADELLKALKVCDSTFVCSMLAIKKIGQHKDGFAIHGRNPGDQWAHCVLPDALIAGPEFRRADDVRVGDKVYGHDGSIQVVEEVISHDFEGNLATISVIGMPAISVTDEHPVLVYRRARRLAGVRQAVIDGHVLDEPTMSPMYLQGWMRHEAAWVMAKDVRKDDFMMTPPIGDAIISPPIALSEELAWLMGFYVGDGHATPNHKIGFTLSMNDPVEKVLQCLEKLGLQGHVKEFGTYRRITAYSAEIANQFLAWFGKTFERRFPSWLIHSEYAEDALEGLVQADGCDYKGKRIVQTVSKSLMLQVCMLVGKLGYRVSMHRRKPGLGGYANSAEAFTVQWYPDSQRRNAGGVVLHKVKSVRLSPHSGRVYNFEVSNTHSFVTDGLAVHNCMRFQGILVASDGAVFIRMSNESWGVEHMYTVPISEVDDWFRRRNLTAAAIGKINGPSSSPPLMGV
jgi:hypothetical protein